MPVAPTEHHIWLQARNEVRLLAGLKHPNVVRYYESFMDAREGNRDEFRLFIVMELCEVSCMKRAIQSCATGYCHLTWELH